MADISTVTVNNGTVLNLKDATARQQISGKVNIDQGTNNAGKFLIVNSSGNVEAVSMSAWQGGSY